MKHLKVASAALAAFIMVGCGDKSSDRSSSGCCQSVAPRYSAQMDGVALIEPQPVLKTLFSTWDKMKSGFSEDKIKEADDNIGFQKELGIEDIAWMTVSVKGKQVVAAVNYPHSLKDALKKITDKHGERFDEIEIAGKPGYAKQDLLMVQDGKVVFVSDNKEAIADQIRLYADGTSDPACADVVPGDKGILTIKVPSIRKSFESLDEVVPTGEMAAFLPEDCLKRCGEFMAKVTTDGIRVSVVADSEADATTIKTSLDAVIAMGKLAFEQNKEMMVQDAPECIQSQLPVIDAAVKTLACAQDGKKVSLSIRIKILDLIEAIAPEAITAL